MTALPAVAHILADPSLRLLSQRFFRLRVVLEHYETLRGGVDRHAAGELLAECAVHAHADLMVCSACIERLLSDGEVAAESIQSASAHVEVSRPAVYPISGCP
jgi:hypothetical protein